MKELTLLNHGTGSDPSLVRKGIRHYTEKKEPELNPDPQLFICL